MCPECCPEKAENPLIAWDGASFPLLLRAADPGVTVSNAPLGPALPCPCLAQSTYGGDGC